MYWCLGVSVNWCTGGLVNVCVCGLAHVGFDVLVFRCFGVRVFVVLVHSCTRCIGRLFDWVIDVLVYCVHLVFWCIGVLVSPCVGGCAYRCVGVVCVFRYWHLGESMYGCFVGLAFCSCGVFRVLGVLV